MSQFRFYYLNQFDTSTIVDFSSQLDGLPASNTQNDIRNKVWRTESGFAVATGINSVFSFKYTASDVVSTYTIPAATYTGSGLATIIQSGMRSVSRYSSHTVVYDSTVFQFTISKGASGTSLSLNFTNNTATSVASLLGFDKRSDYTGTTSYTSSVTTQGNQHFLTMSASTAFSAQTLIIDNHNITTGTVMTFRMASGSTQFVGLTGWSGSASASEVVSLVGTKTVLNFSSVYNGKAFQLSWSDPAQAYSQIGRIFLGTYFQPEFHTSTNEISYRVKELGFRSDTFQSVAGVTFFDRRDPVNVYELPVDPLDQYFNSSTKTGFENLLNHVKNDTPFFISFDNQYNTNTVYGFFVGDYAFERIIGTTIFQIKSLTFQEQK